MRNPYKGQKRIKEIVYNVLGPTLEKQGWYLSKIVLDWRTIIGDQWKHDIWPTRFTPNYKDTSTGTLYLKATHKGLQQASFMKGMLIEKINMYLGCKAISDIKVQLWHREGSPTILHKPSNTTPKSASRIPPDIQSEELRKALMDLGDSLG